MPFDPSLYLPKELGPTGACFQEFSKNSAIKNALQCLSAEFWRYLTIVKREKCDHPVFNERESEEVRKALCEHLDFIKKEKTKYEQAVARFEGASLADRTIGNGKEFSPVSKEYLSALHPYWATVDAFFRNLSNGQKQLAERKAAEAAEKEAKKIQTAAKKAKQTVLQIAVKPDGKQRQIRM